MQTDIPQELQDKLKLIEKETDFGALKPTKPRKGFLINDVITLALGLVGLGGVIAAAITRGWDTDFWIMISLLVLLTMISASSIVSYIERHRLYRLYSTACEIISYYKQNTEKPLNTR